MQLTSASYSELTPGSYVSNKDNIEWGTGQVQSRIKNIVTINFENVGKKVMDMNNIISLEIINT